MQLKKIQRKNPVNKGEVLTSVKIKIEDKKFLLKHNISIKKLFEEAIKDLKEKK